MMLGTLSAAAVTTCYSPDGNTGISPSGNPPTCPSGWTTTPPLYTPTGQATAANLQACQGLIASCFNPSCIQGVLGGNATCYQNLALIGGGLLLLFLLMRGGS